LLYQKPKAIMKQKFLLSFVFVCTFIVSSQAQINKDAIWLGGSIGYSHNKQEMTQNTTNKSSALTITPVIGKVIKDNLVVGIKLGYGRDKSENSSLYTIESKTNSYSGGFFVRRYIPVVNRLYVFGEASASFASFKEKSTQVDFNTNAQLKTITKGWTGGIGVTPGVAFAINKSFQLETTLSNLFGIAYSHSKTSGPTATYVANKTDQFSAGIFTDGKVQFNIGCRFLINTKG
jgi:hypothetical protein